jgi:thioesterase domain-containing protein/acyl carrier protein
MFGALFSKLSAALRYQLPEHMVPSTFVALEEMPLTPSGKVDRLALPPPEPGERPNTQAYIAPNSTAEGIIAGIWADVLNLDKVGIHDNFFDLGGDSLLAMQIVMRVGEWFGVDTPLHLIFQAPTIASMASEIYRSKRKIDHNLLVPMKSGTGAPIYIIHAMDGDVFSYVPVVQAMRKQRPVLAIRATTLDRTESLVEKLSELASKYVDLINVHEEPVCLIGWSFGGLVAYEMACQLRTRGSNLSFIGLIDTYLPSWFEDILQSKENIRGFLSDEIMRAKLTFDRPLTDKDYRASADTIMDPDLNRTFEVYYKHYNYMVAYKPKPVQATIHFFEAMQTHELRSGFPADKWRALAVNGLHKFLVPGNHYTMMQNPNVSTVANYLSTLISS